MKLSQFKLLLLSFLTITGIMLASIATAQDTTLSYDVRDLTDNTHVKVNCKVKLDDNDVYSEDFMLILKNETTGRETIHQNLPNKFAIYIVFDAVYSFKITHKNYNVKTFTVNTKAPKDNWILDCNVYLYSDEPDEVCGGLSYDSTAHRFKFYK